VRIWHASWMITLSAQLAMAANASTSMSRWKCAHYETNAFDVYRGRDADGICCCRNARNAVLFLTKRNMRGFFDEV
jgi:hypothetical protein